MNEHDTLFPLPPGAAGLPLAAARSSGGTPFRTAALALAVASTLAGGAQAQSADGRAPEVIDVTGERLGRNPASMKFTRPLLDTAQTVNVIPEELIAQRASTTLRDVLRNVSGISMQAGEGGTPAGDQLSIRGYSARTDIFVDNVRDFGGYTRDPFNLEQVEVVKGPSSDYSGRGSTGGSINLVSKAPQLEDFAGSTVSLGTDHYTRAALDVNRSVSEGAALRLNLLWHDQDVAGRDEVTNRRFGIAPSVAFGLDGDTQVTLSLFHLRQDNVPDYGIPWVPAGNEALAEYAGQAPPVDFSNWYGLLERDFEEVGTTLGTVQFDQALGGNLRLRNLTRWGLTDRDSMITAPRFVEDLRIRRSDEKYRDQKDDILSNQTNLSLTLNPGAAWEHRLLFGGEVTLEGEKRYTQELLGQDSPATDLFDPTPGDPYLENYHRTGTYSSAASRSHAVYASDSVRIGEHWQINGGLRYDRFELEYRPDGEPLLERTDGMLSYRAGLVYKPVEAGTLYLGYGTSFNPSAEALSLSSGRRSPGLPDLDPEENRSFELGTKWEVFNRRLMLSAALFRTAKTNARTQDPDDPNDLLVLEGEQLVRGIELGLAGSVGERLALYAGYTWLDAEVTDSRDPGEIGRRLDNSPEHSFNFWGTWDVLTNLQLGLGAQYVDDRFSNTSNTRVAPDYWVFEASASYMLNERLNFRLNVQNLSDEKYIDFVGGGHFVPGMGRVALLSSIFSF